MTELERIREKIANALCLEFRHKSFAVLYADEQQSLLEFIDNRILPLVEIRAENQDLPENPYGNPKEFFGAGCYTHAQTDMTEADFVRVIPKGR